MPSPHREEFGVDIENDFQSAFISKKKLERYIAGYFFFHRYLSTIVIVLHVISRSPKIQHQNSEPAAITTRPGAGSETLLLKLFGNPVFFTFGGHRGV